MTPGVCVDWATAQKNQDDSRAWDEDWDDDDVSDDFSQQLKSDTFFFPVQLKRVITEKRFNRQELQRLKDANAMKM